MKQRDESKVMIVVYVKETVEVELKQTIDPGLVRYVLLVCVSTAAVLNDDDR